MKIMKLISFIVCNLKSHFLTFQKIMQMAYIHMLMFKMRVISTNEIYNDWK